MGLNIGDVVRYRTDPHEIEQFRDREWLVVEVHHSPGHQGRGGMDESYPPSTSYSLSMLRKDGSFDHTNPVERVRWGFDGWGHHFGDDDFEVVRVMRRTFV